jgi:hypothetical protein
MMRTAYRKTNRSASPTEQDQPDRDIRSHSYRSIASLPLTRSARPAGVDRSKERVLSTKLMLTGR